MFLRQRFEANGMCYSIPRTRILPELTSLRLSDLTLILGCSDRRHWGLMVLSVMRKSTKTRIQKMPRSRTQTARQKRELAAIGAPGGIPHLLRRCSGQIQWCDVPDFTGIVGNRSIRREVTHARRVQDRHSRPVLLIEVGVA